VLKHRARLARGGHLPAKKKDIMIELIVYESVHLLQGPSKGPHNRLLGKTSYTRFFPGKLFSIIEVNCRFIDIHPCLSSILNVLYNRIYIDRIFKSYHNSDKYLY
jgi:hypothetical protein